MAIQICEGQQYDMNFENRNNVTENEYLEMIKLKTSVLLASSLQIGATIGGASNKNAEYLYDFGLNIGLAFQLQDDFLDVFGDTKTFGKKIGGDIVANKKTYMLIKALEIADADTKKELNNILSMKDFNEQEKINNIIKIYKSLNINNIAKEKMNYFYEKSINSLNQINVDENRKKILINFASNLMKRDN